MGVLEALAGVGGPLELHDPSAVPGDEPAQLGLLVLVAEGDDPLGHRVGGRGRRQGPPEGDVEVTHQRELAPGGGAQVARADDEPLVVAEEEHDPNLTPPTDSAPARHGPRRTGVLTRARGPMHPTSRPTAQYVS